MDCTMCNKEATVRVRWPARITQNHVLCESCASQVWDSISKQFSGTDAYAGFTITPIETMCNTELTGESKELP